jgi:hypothetical protein
VLGGGGTGIRPGRIPCELEQTNLDYVVNRPVALAYIYPPSIFGYVDGGWRLLATYASGGVKVLRGNLKVGRLSMTAVVGHVNVEVGC